MQYYLHMHTIKRKKYNSTLQPNLTIFFMPSSAFYGFFPSIGICRTAGVYPLALSWCTSTRFQMVSYELYLQLQHLKGCINNLHAGHDYFFPK